MQIMTYLTKDYLNIINEFLLPSLPKEIKKIDIVYSTRKDFTWLDKENMILRLEAARDKIQGYQGDQLLFVDADVIFFKNFNIENSLNLLKSNDILFQINGTWPYNTGVWLANCNQAVLNFFNIWIEELKSQKDINIHTSDQGILNNILKSRFTIIAKLFSKEVPTYYSTFFIFL